MNLIDICYHWKTEFIREETGWTARMIKLILKTRNVNDDAYVNDDAC